MLATPQIFPIAYQSDSARYFQQLATLPNRVWLDSGEYAGNDAGEFDILTAAPEKFLYSPTIEALEHENALLAQNTDFSEALQLDLPFCGGIVGVFNYEHQHAKMKVQSHKNSFSESVFGVYHWALIQNHKRQQSHLIFLPNIAKTDLDRVLTLVNTPSLEAEQSTHFQVSHLKMEVSENDYKNAIKKVKRYLRAGDSYQVNYTARYKGSFSGDTDSAFMHLRNVMPNTFSAYCDFPKYALLSFSPERFIKIEQGHAITQPIKGTIARGKTPTEDRANARALESSEKNRAENIMIVDLLRNDFNKNCERNSVIAEPICELHAFSNVHHLVSTVKGRVKTDVSALAFFVDCFPGGSITGAPKRRAMQIIDELETHSREVYCGSLIYYSAHGKLDSSILIRSLVVHENSIYCWSGGGIVMDSNADDEYQESLTKTHALINALNTTL